MTLLKIKQHYYLHTRSTGFLTYYQSIVPLEIPPKQKHPFAYFNYKRTDVYHSNI